MYRGEITYNEEDAFFLLSNEIKYFRELGLCQPAVYGVYKIVKHSIR